MTQPASSGTSLPVLVDALAAQLVSVYAAAEQQLMAQLAAAARRGVAQPGVAAELTMLREMRRASERVATMLRLRAYPLAEQIVTQATAAGAQSALDELGRLTRSATSMLKPLTRPAGHGDAAAARITLDLATRLTAAAHRITRFADDAYRAAVVEAAKRQTQSQLVPAAAQRAAWDDLMSRGVSGYRDSSGRNWNLSSYVEMATRTAVQRAFNAAHLDRMLAFGVEFFTVPDDGHPCPLCLPWQGKVLSNTQAGMLTVRAADRPGFVHVDVAATVAEATDAGLFHPMCRHVLTAYLPGVTDVAPPREWTEQDQARYAATQRLRALERAVREQKRLAETALTPLEQKRAQARARALQAQIRAHVDATGLVRRPRREQLNLGNG